MFTTEYKSHFRQHCNHCVSCRACWCSTFYPVFFSALSRHLNCEMDEVLLPSRMNRWLCFSVVSTFQVVPANIRMPAKMQATHHRSKETRSLKLSDLQETHQGEQKRQKTRNTARGEIDTKNCDLSSLKLPSLLKSLVWTPYKAPIHLLKWSKNAPELCKSKVTNHQKRKTWSPVQGAPGAMDDHILYPDENLQTRGLFWGSIQQLCPCPTTAKWLLGSAPWST